jgi:hypothetical protein
MVQRSAYVAHPIVFLDLTGCSALAVAFVYQKLQVTLVGDGGQVPSRFNRPRVRVFGRVEQGDQHSWAHETLLQPKIYPQVKCGWQSVCLMQ